LLLIHGGQIVLTNLTMMVYFGPGGPKFIFNTITHLNKPIKVFGITRKLQAGDFFRVGAKLCKTLALQDCSLDPVN